MSAQQIIETGVDKLVSLIKKRGKIPFSAAARELGVSEEVIKEWVDFLEEESIVGVEYKLTTPYIVEKKVTKKIDRSELLDPRMCLIAGISIRPQATMNRIPAMAAFGR